MSNALPLDHEVTPSNQEKSFVTNSYNYSQKINKGNYIAPLKKRKMATQLVIKLNKAKYGPLIDDIKEKCQHLVICNSEVAAFAIFYLHCLFSEEIKPGKTRADIMKEAFSNGGELKSESKFLIDIMKKFRDFHLGT